MLAKIFDHNSYESTKYVYVNCKTFVKLCVKLNRVTILQG